MPPHERPVQVGVMALAIRAADLGSARDYECGIHGRLMRFRPTGPAESAAIAERLGLSGLTAGAEYVVWEVRVDPFAAPVTTVRLRLGTADAPGSTLCAFPFPAAEDDECGHVRMFVSAEGSDLPFEELWQLIQREPVHVEVMLEDAVEPLAIGPLTPLQRNGRSALC